MHHEVQIFELSWQPSKKHSRKKTEIQEHLGEEVDSTEESEPEVWVSDMGLDSGLVLDDPDGEVHGDPFVPQEIGAFGSGIGFKHVPEMPSHPHYFSE